MVPSPSILNLRPRQYTPRPNAPIAHTARLKLSRKGNTHNQRKSLGQFMLSAAMNA
jgi:hypothetical protein